MKILPLIAFLLLASCACRQPNPNPKWLLVVIDDSFDEYQSVKIQEALNYWAEETNINLNLQIRDITKDRYFWKYDKTITIYYARTGWQKHAYNDLDKDWYAIGATVISSKDVFLTDVGKNIFKLAMHEFGHVLGCDHVGDRKDIMYPFITSEPARISQKDIRIARKNYPNYIKE